MLRIRLQRVGRKHDPSYRVVLTDRRNAAQSGRFLELLGSYNARHGEPQLKADRIKYWISKGAKPTDTLHNLLINQKVIEGKKVNVLPKKSPIKKEEEQKEEKQTEETSGEEKPAEEAPAEEKAEEKPEEKAEEPKAEPTPAEEDKKEEQADETPEDKKEEESKEEEKPAPEDKKDEDQKEEEK